MWLFSLPIRWRCCLSTPGSWRGVGRLRPFGRYCLRAFWLSVFCTLTICETLKRTPRQAFERWLLFWTETICVVVSVSSSGAFWDSFGGGLAGNSACVDHVENYHSFARWLSRMWLPQFLNIRTVISMPEVRESWQARAANVTIQSVFAMWPWHCQASWNNEGRFTARGYAAKALDSDKRHGDSLGRGGASRATWRRTRWWIWGRQSLPPPPWVSECSGLPLSRLTKFVRFWGTTYLRSIVRMLKISQSCCQLLLQWCCYVNRLADSMGSTRRLLWL